jgi:hypothetical protein
MHGRLHRLLLTAIVPLAACGSTTRASTDRPPAPVNVTAAIHESRVQVSPGRIGGGPVVIIVSNQSRRAQRLTVETAGRAAGVRRSTGPIAPQGTARLSLDVSRGSYLVRASDARSARLRVGARRRSAQDDLLQP